MTVRHNRSATTADPSDRLSQRNTFNSTMSPESLRAAAQADDIPVQNRWGPARTLLLVAGASGGLWGLIALARFALSR